MKKVDSRILSFMPWSASYPSIFLSVSGIGAVCIGFVNVHLQCSFILFDNSPMGSFNQSMQNVEPVWMEVSRSMKRGYLNSLVSFVSNDRRVNC